MTIANHPSYFQPGLHRWRGQRPGLHGIHWALGEGGWQVPHRESWTTVGINQLFNWHSTGEHDIGEQYCNPNKWNKWSDKNQKLINGNKCRHCNHIERERQRGSMSSHDQSYNSQRGRKPAWLSKSTAKSFVTIPQIQPPGSSQYQQFLVNLGLEFSCRVKSELVISLCWCVCVFLLELNLYPTIASQYSYYPTLKSY